MKMLKYLAFVVLLVGGQVALAAKKATKGTNLKEIEKRIDTASPEQLSADLRELKAKLPKKQTNKNKKKRIEEAIRKINNRIKIAGREVVISPAQVLDTIIMKNDERCQELKANIIQIAQTVGVKFDENKYALKKAMAELIAQENLGRRLDVLKGALSSTSDMALFKENNNKRLEQLAADIKKSDSPDYSIDLERSMAEIAKERELQAIVSMVEGK